MFGKMDCSLLPLRFVFCVFVMIIAFFLRLVVGSFVRSFVRSVLNVV